MIADDSSGDAFLTLVLLLPLFTLVFRLLNIETRTLIMLNQEKRTSTLLLTPAVI